MKWSIDKVRKEVEKGGDSLISERYVSANEKIRIKCGICETIYDKRWSNYMRGVRCNLCSLRKQSERQRHSIEYVKNKIKEGGDTLLSDTYINAHTKLHIQCCKCKMVYISCYNRYQQGNRCKKCSDKEKGFKLRNSFDDVKKYIEDKGDCLISEQYTTAKEKLKIKCQNCSEVYKMSYTAFKGGSRCQKCANKIRGSKKRLKFEYVKEYIENHGDILLSETYTSAKIKLDVKCQKCNYVYHPFFHNYKRGHRCPNCFGNKRKTIDEIRDMVKQDGEILISKKYKNSLSFLKILCKRCSRQYTIKYREYAAGCRCNACCFSKGESAVEKYLKEKGLVFEWQKSFPDCKNINYLRFDFYVEKSENINFLIEYNGLQHYKPIEYFGGDEKFKKQQINDNIKKTYCEKNDIPLLIISYEQYEQISEIIDTFIKELS
jgi:hypothetical protein